MPILMDDIGLVLVGDMSGSDGNVTNFLWNRLEDLLKPREIRNLYFFRSQTSEIRAKIGKKF